MTHTSASPQSIRAHITSRLRPAPDVLPIISIAGTRGKSTVAWMLTRVLDAAGLSHGAWLSSGVYVQGELEHGELGPWSRVVLAARYSEIDVAVQELVPETVVAAGLPEAAYPVTILTTLCGNNEACLTTAETRLVRRSLEHVIRSVRPDGVIVANADDFDIAALSAETSGERWLFALHYENPALQQHIRNGEPAVWIRDGTVYASSQAWPTHERLMDAGKVTGTLDGTILFQLQNVLATVATSLAIGLTVDHIRGGLDGFEPSVDLQPGACNIVRFNEATIVVDAPRQITSLRMLARGIRHKPHRRTLVVSGCLPGLSDDQLNEGGRILGGLGGVVLLHGEHADRRRMDVIRRGIGSASIPPLVLSMKDEGRALDYLLNTIAPKDVAVVIVDDEQAVLGQLWPAPTISIASARREWDKPDE